MVSEHRAGGLTPAEVPLRLVGELVMMLLMIYSKRVLIE